MSENINTNNRDNTSNDSEFQNMLKEVFGQKDKIIHDRFKNQGKQANDSVFKKPATANSDQSLRKPVQRPLGQIPNKRPPQHAPKRPQVKADQPKRPTANDIRFKKPANNQKGSNVRNGGQKPTPKSASRPPQQRRPQVKSTLRPIPASPGMKNGNSSVKHANQSSQHITNGMKKSNTNKDKILKCKNGKVLTKKQRILRISGLILAAVLVLLLAGYCIYHFYFSMFGRYSGNRNNGEYYYNESDYTNESNTLTPEEAEAALKKQLKGQATDLMKDKDVMNILLIGEDLRDTEESERGNTDVMMMISLNKKQKTITMTSFMRDAWVYIDDYGQAKLNAAYWIDGPELLKSTIQQHYGVSIDRYVIVNFESFIKIVDTLGGITLNISDEEAEGMKAPMAEQNNILGNKKGTDYLSKGGNLKLNGNQALAYARLRYVGNADYERTERQRRVIKEIIKESKNLTLVKINSLLREILPKVKIDLTEGEVASMLLDCFDYMNYDIQELRIPADEMFSEEIIDGLSVLCPDFTANTREMIKTVYGQEALDKYDQENQQQYDTYDNNYNYDNTYDNNYGYDNGYYGY